MRYKICVIRDRALDAFGVPVFVASKGQAIRSFSDEVNRVDPNNSLNKHPEDFEMFYLGEYDDETATFECERPQQLAVGKDVVIKS